IQSPAAGEELGATGVGSAAQSDSGKNTAAAARLVLQAAAICALNPCRAFDVYINLALLMSS
ncbi:MAG: hypothetical protein OXK72_09550, partial [Gammaproteobacteria bacterium]|nr:hypothetical protein [Gammaproteobacteria bacterium]